jgi:hypothetical protein
MTGNSTFKNDLAVGGGSEAHNYGGEGGAIFSRGARISGSTSEHRRSGRLGSGRTRRGRRGRSHLRERAHAGVQRR